MTKMKARLEELHENFAQGLSDVVEAQKSPSQAMHLMTLSTQTACALAIIESIDALRAAMKEADHA